MKSKIKDLNETFNKYFFKKISFILDGKIIKEGRLKLFSMKGFNFKFFLIDDNNIIKAIEMPYPFNLIETKNGYIFDYRLDSFKLLNKSELLDNLLKENTVKSRYFDKSLILKIKC